MVDDHIKNDVDAAGVAGVDEVFQFLERSLCGVDIEEIGGVILVVRRVAGIAPLSVHLHAGNPHRVDAHAGEVIEVVLEAFPVAAVVEVAVVGERAAAVIDEPRGAVDTHRLARVVGRVAIGEAIGEKLINIHIPPILRGRKIRVALRTREQAVNRIKPEARILREGQRHRNRENGQKGGQKEAAETGQGGDGEAHVLGGSENPDDGTDPTRQERRDHKHKCDPRQAAHHERLPETVGRPHPKPALAAARLIF